MIYENHLDTTFISKREIHNKEKLILATNHHCHIVKTITSPLRSTKYLRKGVINANVLKTHCIFAS